MVGSLVAALLLVSTAPPPSRCSAPLPDGPAVPAPIVLQTSCGGFRLATDGRVARLPRGFFAAHGGGTGRRFGSDLQVRRNRPGRIVLLRKGRVVWRSSRLYPNDAGNVAFGPGRFAFSSYGRGVFVTDLRSPERLVRAGVGRFPIDFTREGRLIVAGGRSLTIVSAAGRARELRYRVGSSFAFDPASDTLYFLTLDRRLARFRDGRLRHGPTLAGIDGAMRFSQPGLLLFESEHGLTVVRTAGFLVARASWEKEQLRVSDSGVGVSDDGRRFAFRLSNVRPGARSGTAAVYVLEAGQATAQELYRHALGAQGCAPGSTLSWSGSSLLYGSADGELVVLDGSRRRARVLTRFARALPKRGRLERARAFWAAAYG